MGVVLRARDTKLLRDVALKVLPVEPKWRRDSRELYYLAFDGKLMSVAVKPDGTFGTPVPLFETGLAVNRAQPDRTRRYDVAPHGHF